MDTNCNQLSMYRRILTIVVGLLVLPAMAQTPEMASKIDQAMTEKIWVFIKQETHAPDNLALPPIVFDDQVPKEARMVFQFPSVDAPDNTLQISIGTYSTRFWNQEMMLWALGHELTHYAFLMQENQWQQKIVYENNIRHHCNFEFMRITRDVVEVIWEKYQNVAARMRMYSEVHKSCSRQPTQ
jgi:hypothetical protein